MHSNVVLNSVRFNWVRVLEPKSFQADDPERYQVEVLIEPDSEAHKVLVEAVQSAAADKWGAKAKGYLGSATANRKCAMKDGNTMPPDKNTGELPDYYKDAVVLSCGRKLDRDGPLRVFCLRKSTGKLVEVTKDTKFDDDLVGPNRGNHGKVMVSLWGWEHNGSPQINCTVETIAFLEEGEPLGGQAPLKTDAIKDAFGVDIDVDETPF